MIAKIASSVPYMVSVGNHEYDHSANCNNGGADVSGVGVNGYHPIWGNMGDDSNGECGASTYYRFNASTNGNSIFWYSFDYNMVHFVMLSSEHNYSANAPGRIWLENDLRNVDREQSPWLIVNIHRPLYESEDYAGDTTVSQHLVTLLEPNLLEYEVDLVLGGHYHSYERTCALKEGQCVENGGIVHLTFGAAGIGLDTAGYRGEEWSLFRDHIHWGFGRFYVNYTSLTAEFVALKDGDNIIDSVTLTKSAKPTSNDTYDPTSRPIAIPPIAGTPGKGDSRYSQFSNSANMGIILAACFLVICAVSIGCAMLQRLRRLTNAIQVGLRSFRIPILKYPFSSFFIHFHMFSYVIQRFPTYEIVFQCTNTKTRQPL